MKVSPLFCAILVCRFANLLEAQQTVPINLGPTGTTYFGFNGVKIPFPDLNGLALTGQSLSFNFVFNEPIRIYNGGFGADFNAWIFFDVQPTPASSPYPMITGTGSLIDPSNVLIKPVVLGAGTGLAGPSTVVGFESIVTESLGDLLLPLDVGGVRFDLSLPNLGGSQITAETLWLWSRNNAFVVGPVPDDGPTIVLFAFATVVALIARQILTRPKISGRWRERRVAAG